MKLLATFLLTSSALLACLSLPACSGASGGAGGVGNDGGSSSSSGGGSGGGSGSGSGGGGNTTCTGAMPCGSAGVTYETCTTTAPGSQSCQSIEYKTSAGKSFTCDCSGASCTKAADDLSTYCATAVPDAGSTTTTCLTPQPCGTTGLSYQQCTTSDAQGCVGKAYKVSNGTEFNCANCNDCSNALSSLDATCQGTGNPVTTCTSWATCGTSSLQYEECTTTVNGTCTGMYYQTSDSQTFQCAACGNCSAASTSMESYCSSMSQMTTCGSATACGSTGVTYQSCTTTLSGTCESAYYTTSDGQQFSCASCSDCSSAISSLDTYCSSLGGVTCGSTTCSSGYLCCSCSGAQQCLSSNGGTYTCATYGCM